METLLFLSDTFTSNVAKAVGSSSSCIQEASTNCQNVIVVAIICGTIVLITLIVAVSLLVYFRIKNSKLGKQQEAERIKEKEDKWFSLRKEYQSAILSILKLKETPNQKEDTLVERKAESEEQKDDSKEKYIKELRDCIKWIDSQMK